MRNQSLGWSSSARARTRSEFGGALKILNALAALIVVSSAGYALSYSMADARTYSWVIAINLALVVMALCVPLMHRVHEIFAGLVIAVTECIALVALVALLGRESGIQLNLIVGAVAAFFILGLDHLTLGIAIIVLCMFSTSPHGSFFRSAWWPLNRFFLHSSTSPQRSPSLA